jgi:hypothetical protein
MLDTTPPADHEPTTGHEPALAHREGVDGSSPSEGFDFIPAQPPFPLSALASLSSFSVHRASTAWTSIASALR